MSSCGLPERLLSYGNVGPNVHVEAPLASLAHGDQNHAPVQVARLTEYGGLRAGKGVPLALLFGILREQKFATRFWRHLFLRSLVRSPSCVLYMTANFESFQACVSARSVELEALVLCVEFVDNCCGVSASPRLVVEFVDNCCGVSATQWLCRMLFFISCRNSCPRFRYPAYKIHPPRLSEVLPLLFSAAFFSSWSATPSAFSSSPAVAFRRHPRTYPKRNEHCRILRTDIFTLLTVPSLRCLFD